MKITNETAFQAGWTVGFRPDGREVAVVAVKATYRLRPPDGEPGLPLAEVQAELFDADTFGADPATDAPVYENDFALFKPQCDILLRGQAYAPDGKVSHRVRAGLMVGSCKKIIDVVGDRYWERTLGTTGASEPVPFLHKEISYDVAFGGVDKDPADETRIETFLSNPAGTGFCRFTENLDGMPLPNTEEAGKSVSDPDGDYRPMAFGPLGRNWLPRYTYAGTYDEQWLNHKLPFLPDDFNPIYFQAAPEDQRVPYPGGGEPIVLARLTADGRVDSTIPRESVHVTFLRVRGKHAEVDARLDTVLIEPDEDRLCLTWRSVLPLDRDPFELREIVVECGSSRSRAKRRARLTGKTYFRDLTEAVRSQRGRRGGG